MQIIIDIKVLFVEFSDTQDFYYRIFGRGPAFDVMSIKPTINTLTAASQYAFYCFVNIYI